MKEEQTDNESGKVGTVTETKKRRVKERVKRKIRGKVKFSRYRPGLAQMVGRGIALLFHDCGTRRG